MNVIDRQIEIEIPKGKVLEGVSLSDTKIAKPSNDERRLVPLFRSLHSVIAGVTSSRNSAESPENPENSAPNTKIDINAELAKPEMRLSDLMRIVNGGKDGSSRLQIKPAHHDSLVSAAAQANIIPGDDPKAA